MMNNYRLLTALVLALGACLEHSHALASDETQLSSVRCETIRDDGKKLIERTSDRTGTKLFVASYECLCGDWYLISMTQEEELCGARRVSVALTATNQKELVQVGKGYECVVHERVDYVERRFRAVTLCDQKSTPSYPASATPTPRPVGTPGQVPSRCEIAEDTFSPIHEWVTVTKNGETKEVLAQISAQELTTKTPIGIPRPDIGICEVKWKTRTLEVEAA
jgi:hypothetical protein